MLLTPIFREVLAELEDNATTLVIPWMQELQEELRKPPPYGLALVERAAQQILQEHEQPRCRDCGELLVTVPDGFGTAYSCLQCDPK